VHAARDAQGTDRRAKRAYKCLITLYFAYSKEKVCKGSKPGRVAVHNSFIVAHGSAELSGLTRCGEGIDASAPFN